MKSDEPKHGDILIGQTDYLKLVEQAGWSFVKRRNSSGVVCMVAVTDDDQLVLVEQHRPPVANAVIELPAGLVGDLAHAADETLREAAERELLEETGYAASEWTLLVTAASSAGLTDELITFFLATGLEKKHAGGGDETEDIRVHTVPMVEVDEWLDQALSDGKLLDAKIYAGIHFARSRKR